MCPYCCRADRPNSKDHVFSEFLGGKATIKACKKCNDILGHDVEGPAFVHLRSVAVSLVNAGLQAPKYLRWKRAYKDEATGDYYDLDTDWKLHLSSPQVKRGDGGTTVLMARSAGRSHLKKLKKRGFEVEVKETSLAVPFLNVPVYVHIKKLEKVALKMAIALASLLKLPLSLDAQTRQFLLGIEQASPAILADFTVHNALESLRPPLSHVIYVEGNSRTHHSCAIVQFYGIFQFYVTFGEEYQGPDFGGIGILDTNGGYKETFSTCDSLACERPQRIFSPWAYTMLQNKWQAKCEAEIRSVFGSDGIRLKIAVPPRFETLNRPSWGLEDGTARLTSFPSRKR